ncbi:RAN GTPase-activating protein [Trifolium repens]|nr:RAN GTPase-activating protein [Trifolium repens]
MKKHRKGDEAIFVISPYTIKMEEAENLRLAWGFNLMGFIFITAFSISHSGSLDMDSTVQSYQHRSLSIKLWPPSQSTRLMLVERMTKNLTTPSIFSRKYGLLSKEEAEVDAKEIEDAAFVTATQHFEKEPDGDGSSAVQIYAKESSKLMLEVLKRGPRRKEDGEFVSEKAGATVETVFDISGGRRAFIDKEEASELLKPLMAPSSFTKICFSNRSFGLDAAHVAEPILISIKDQLKEVDLSDFIAGRPEAEALEVMNIFSSALEGSILRYLNLSNNAMGEKGVRAFRSLLKSQNDLEELYLMNDGISEEAAKAVAELIPSTEKLKVLHFHNNMTGDEGAFAIAEVVKRSPALEDFRCSSTRVGSEGGVALAEALGACTHLKKLDLRDNMFGVEAGVALSKVIPLFVDLTEIYLSYLNLEDDGAEALANALKESAPSLEILDMAGNDISATAAVSVAACVSSKQFLTKLNLSENELKDEGAALLSKALEEGHGQLNEVDLSTNLITWSGAKLLAEAVVQKPGFKLLNINANFISDEGIDELKEIFKNSPDMLGPLDENDPEGEDIDEEAEDSDNDELESKLKGLEI